ncbi:MAG: DUF3515 family protein [Actinobacteria bacterium]|uniref:Unannotated protein n=1 Tax=freshwater metagenome TaxID=449393 RepID=A0A6J6RAA4_9ZZZZ|nr:DUF3515 family protein [Actinomycetota bacterium]
MSALPGALVLASLVGCSAGPVEVASPELSADDQAACTALLDSLPATLAGLESHEITPADAPAAAWGDDGLTLSCGVGVPDDFDEFSRCDQILGVGWFFPEAEYKDESRTLTATAVGYRPRISLTVPADYRGNVSLDAFSTLAPLVQAHLDLVQRCR